MVHRLNMLKPYCWAPPLEFPIRWSGLIICIPHRFPGDAEALVKDCPLSTTALNFKFTRNPSLGGFPQWLPNRFCPQPQLPGPATGGFAVQPQQAAEPWAGKPGLAGPVSDFAPEVFQVAAPSVISL